VRPSGVRARPAITSTAPMTINNLAKFGIDFSLPKVTMLIHSPAIREKLSLKKRDGGMVAS